MPLGTAHPGCLHELYHHPMPSLSWTSSMVLAAVFVYSREQDLPWYVDWLGSMRAPQRLQVGDQTRGVNSLFGCSCCTR